MSEEILTRVVKIVSQELEKDPSEVTPESSFANDLDADSLDVVEIVMGLETEFDIEIPDEDAEKMDTVGKAVEYIASKVQAAA